MKAYKGFNKDMTCRGFQYKEGGEYKTDRAQVCECGFHACENPLDCLNYYEPSQSVYHEVELDGALDKSGKDTKVAATKIKIGARLNIAGIVKSAIDFVMNKVKGKDSIAAVLGKDCKARGGLGCWLVLTERDDNWHILGVKAVCIDGEKYKPDTWYALRDGEVVEEAE